MAADSYFRRLIEELTQKLSFRYVLKDHAEYKFYNGILWVGIVLLMIGHGSILKWKPIFTIRV
jgi:hypothetical protein